MKADFGQPDLSNAELHNHLQSNLGRMETQEARCIWVFECVELSLRCACPALGLCREVKVSRFFQWAGRWQSFAPHWTFWRIILDQWHALKGAEERPPEEAAPDDDGQAARGRGRQAHTNLLEDLRKMQKTRHSLEVVRDILHDGRIRDYAHMQLGSSSLLTPDCQPHPHHTPTTPPPHPQCTVVVRFV